MPIDIYMIWDNQTEDEKQGQYTRFSADSGFTGYLREAYKGSPYVTQFLVKEVFESEEGKASIPSHVLRGRLPEALKLHVQRHKNIYKEDVKETDPPARSFTDFVELYEQLEDAGKNPTIIVSY